MALVVAGSPAAVEQVVGDSEALLSPVERTRADRFRFPLDREAFVAAHALTRECAAQVLGISANRLTVVQRCDRCGGPHGRPWLAEAPDVFISLSHTRGYVAAAVDLAMPVGVDVEAVASDGTDGELARLVLTAAEREQVATLDDPRTALFRHWVRKESLIKVGAGDLADVAAIPVSYGDDVTSCVTPSGRRQFWQFTDWSSDAAPSVVGCAVRPRGTPVELLLL